MQYRRPKHSQGHMFRDYYHRLLERSWLRPTGSRRRVMGVVCRKSISHRYQLRILENRVKLKSEIQAPALDPPHAQVLEIPGPRERLRAPGAGRPPRRLPPRRLAGVRAHFSKKPRIASATRYGAYGGGYVEGVLGGSVIKHHLLLTHRSTRLIGHSRCLSTSAKKLDSAGPAFVHRPPVERLLKPCTNRVQTPLISSES